MSDFFFFSVVHCGEETSELIMFDFFSPFFAFLVEVSYRINNFYLFFVGGKSLFQVTALWQ